MKNIFNREWLENYKTIPKRDNTIYKNYQNPGMTNWDRQFGSLSPAQKGRYEGFLNTIPDELKGLSAAEMQKYLQGVDEKQAALAQERKGYDTQIQNIKNQEAQAKQKAELERNLYRPMATNNGPSGGSYLTYDKFRYNGGELVPFNVVKEMIRRGIIGRNINHVVDYYTGYGQDHDPFRPFHAVRPHSFPKNMPKEQQNAKYYAYYERPLPGMSSSEWNTSEKQFVPYYVLEQLAKERGQVFDSNNFSHFNWYQTNSS